MAARKPNRNVTIDIVNTSALKSFAPAVRRPLMEAVARKLDVALAAQTPDYRTTYAAQVAALRKAAQADREGLVERAAYAWFNRLAALRYLDAHGWHPFRTRVLTPATPEETQPELLKLMRTGALPRSCSGTLTWTASTTCWTGGSPRLTPRGCVNGAGGGRARRGGGPDCRTSSLLPHPAPR